MSVGSHDPKAKLSKQEQIVVTAYRLFGENGFFATGVDQIMKTAGVSKRTLYKYFPTKNQLIVAVLEYYQEGYKQHLVELLDVESKNSREKIALIFEDAMLWFNRVDFHGCLAVHAMSEFSGKDDAVETSCLDFKHWELNILRELCSELVKPEQLDELAYKLFVLLEGMSAIAQMQQTEFPVDMVKMADDIIQCSIAQSLETRME